MTMPIYLKVGTPKWSHITLHLIAGGMLQAQSINWKA